MKKLFYILLAGSLAFVASLTLWGNAIAPEAHQVLNSALDRFDEFVLEQHTLKRYREGK